MKGYLPAYALTLGVEPPLYAVAVRALGERWWRGYRLGLLGNATSHPLTWLVLYPVVSDRAPAVAALVVAEAFAVAWEAGLLRLRLGRELPSLVAVALVVNAVSVGLGALLLR